MKKIIPIVLMMVLLVPTLLATSIEIDMKPSFNIGEEILFSYTIVSETSQEISYTPLVDCPSAPISPLERRTTNLEAGVPFTETYVYMSELKDDVEPQTCKVIVGIISPEEISEEKSFSIVGDPGFEFDIKLDKKIFVKNEEVEINFDSGVSGLEVIATLTNPNGKTEQLILPTTIESEQIGTYFLDVVASKDGYRTMEKTIEFGVIKREANIKSSVEGVSFIDRIKENWLYFLIGGVVLIIVFLVVKLRKEGYL